MAKNEKQLQQWEEELNQRAQSLENLEQKLHAKEKELAKQSQSQMKGRPGIPGSIEQPKSAFRDASKERRDRLAKEEAEKKIQSQEPDESIED